ncbi:ABC transporter permease [Kordiimonas lacus]|uniref:NitT/TauT family transport system permease protein n=1 Tax=Kordiimonas lacus TaxID=637679 RepID=A0A1G6WS43_9PROT|nr:ABC transporter permease [Kordiimonas lacus]SDD68708.1 NitT/TauT family transport system permease protein [Kordiimonas lacus]
MRKVLLPSAAFLLMIFLWKVSIEVFEIPKFILPTPEAVWAAFFANFGSLVEALGATLKVTFIALSAAVFSGVMLALLFSLSRSFEMTFYPFAVVLQVTPIVSVAPLVLIWVGIDHVDRALVIIAWLAAFFPILANMSAGLRSVDRHLDDLFTLYGASRWQRFWRLSWPTAMPYLLASLKISGGLALIGAVVAEFVAGSGGATGLAWRILEAGNRLQVEKMFAGLVLLSLAGVAIFYFFTALEWFILRRRK